MVNVVIAIIFIIIGTIYSFIIITSYEVLRISFRLLFLVVVYFFLTNFLFVTILEPTISLFYLYFINTKYEVLFC